MYVRSTRRWRESFLTALLPILSACEGQLSTLDPAGPNAARIATLWWTMFAGAIVLLALVLGLLWWAYRRPGFAAQASTRTWLLYGGVLMPTVVLTMLVAYALFVGERLDRQVGGSTVQVEAIGSQWTWTFRYPQMGGTQTSVLHLPAGQPIDITVESQDVIHSFWVPRLGGKIDAIPGHKNVIRLQADTPGRHEAICAEFCGIGHTHMRFEVIVHPADEYRSALLGSAQ